MQVVLYQPEIPGNTGNIARFCAAFNIPLNLIEPLAFQITDRHVKRAGLDYWPYVRLKKWINLDEYISSIAPRRVVLTSARRGISYLKFNFHKEDAIVFGPETRGLPDEVFSMFPKHIVTIPIRKEVRSLNLANSVSIILSEAMRQVGMIS